MTRIRFLAIFIALGVLTAATPAQARRVYLNGVDISNVDISSVTLRNCTVRIDRHGNVFIKAPGYKIQVEGSSGSGSSGSGSSGSGSSGGGKAVGSSTARYFLVNFFNKQGAAQYDIEVFINGNMVRRYRARSGQSPMDVTRYIKRGRSNEVVFVARKNYGSHGRTSTSRFDYLRVVLGYGFESKGQVVLRGVVAEMRRTAAETNTSYTVRHRLRFK